jgi:hypothetical protein
MRPKHETDISVTARISERVSPGAPPVPARSRRFARGHFPSTAKAGRGSTGRHQHHHLVILIGAPTPLFLGLLRRSSAALQPTQTSLYRTPLAVIAAYHTSRPLCSRRRQTGPPALQTTDATSRVFDRAALVARGGPSDDAAESPPPHPVLSLLSSRLSSRAFRNAIPS